MKKNLLIFCVSFFSFAYTKNLNFTDSKFKALILSSNASNGIAKDINGNSIAIDANGDDEIQVSEAQQVVILDVKMDATQKYDVATGEINFPYYFNHLPENISDALLFTNVEELYISDTKNANISFVNNNKIKKLMCMNRWFYDEGSFNGNFYESDFFPVDFTIDNCPSILTMNDISAFYHPSFLGQAIFRIKNNPQFNGALALNDKLVSELYFENINLTSINIDDCRGLVKLSVPNIATLQTINITNTQDSQTDDQEINLIANNCTSLYEIILDGDYYDSRAVYLSAINVNGCPSLNKIKGLNAPNIDFSGAGLVNLEELDCAFYNRYGYTSSSFGSVILGKVNSINLTDLPNLKKLLAYNQPISNIDFIVCPSLEEINIVNSASFMTSINVSNLTNLQTLDVHNVANPIDLPENLQQINAQNCTALTTLEIWGNYDLKSLNLQNCSSLQYLIIGNNFLHNSFPDLNTLNLLQCSGLEELYIKDTKINSLNIGNCTALKSLVLESNDFLPEVNISQNGALESLHIADLPLLANLSTSTNNINVKSVGVLNCPLITQLDFSTLSDLEIISLYDMTNLISANLRNNSLEQVYDFYNYNSNLSICVDDADLVQVQGTYPDINFSNNCNNLITTIWNGTIWSNGIPTASVNAIINAPYSTASNPAFTAKNIIVNNGAALEITSGNTINAADVTIKNGGNLIQRDGSTLNYTGTFKVKKYSTSDFDKYAFWSSPVVSQNLNAIYGTGITPAFITEYNTATNYFVNAASPISLFGKGYSIKTPVANASVTFTGVPNNGSQTYMLSTATNGFNLVGNPYPSNLNLDTFYTANSARILNTFYFWDNTSNSVTTQGGTTTTNIGYATYNPLTQVWVPAPNISTVPTGNTAPVGQAFFVKTLSSSVDTSLSFTNEMRVATAGTFFNKNNSSTEGKFWLRLNSPYNTSNTMAVAYINAASDSFDNYDSKAMATGSDAFYTFADTQKLIIQGKADFDINDIVPVGAKHFENGNFTISLVQKEGIFNNGQAIYLHDKELGTYTNLQNQAYSFAANAGEFGNRFEIVYKLNVLSTSEVQKNTLEVYRDGEDFYVRNNKNIETVEVFDATGRKIQEIKENSKLVRIKLDDKGLYILKAISEGKEYIKKLIK
ncbi:MAG: hypothetical protein K0R77_3116 [Chryseobacterium sp.]|jgi:hypothetical protein|uniref:T9SS type A sorting domain-containing protein n=1 Tax=Chryseobacterium sp. TaxID=1871047 RepID=UPI002603778B|nr:T9SS type A sorting domain-containing protein [Chryseobacterium sp.]MDF2553841.1 hypothetical protein [Chryseobacterium sp.]